MRHLECERRQYAPVYRGAVGALEAQLINAREIEDGDEIHEYPRNILSNLHKSNRRIGNTDDEYTDKRARERITLIREAVYSLKNRESVLIKLVWCQPLLYFVRQKKNS